MPFRRDDKFNVLLNDERKHSNEYFTFTYPLYFSYKILPKNTSRVKYWDVVDTIDALLRPITETFPVIVKFCFSEFVPDMTTLLNHRFVPRQEGRNLQGCDAGPQVVFEVPSLKSTWHSSPRIPVHKIFLKHHLNIIARLKLIS